MTSLGTWPDQSTFQQPALDMVETWEFEQFGPQEFIAQGDKVVALGQARSMAKSTGRAIETDWVHLFTLRSGKITEVRGFEDTAAVAAAFR